MMDKFHTNIVDRMPTGKFVLFSIVIILSLSHLSCVSAQIRQNRTTTYSYVCPRDFIRLGGSCYHFSKTQASWDEAYFYCKDKNSNLTVPERWEDRNIREYLNQDEADRGDRWMGGLYDWEAKAWKWGGELRIMKYQSFSRMPRLPPERLKWHCVAMIPELLYRWSPRVCIEKKYFICQTRLKKVNQNQINRWNTNINVNEVPLPESDLDNEVNPNMSPNYMNDFNTDQQIDTNSISNNVGQAAFAHRRKTGNDTRIKRKKKPFPGYKKIKGDPEATYLHNVNALKSGKSGLSPAQIEKHLHRLERLRRKEERTKRRMEISRNQRNRQRNKLRKIEEKDSVLSADTSNIRSRHIISSKDGEPPKSMDKNVEFKGLLSIQNVTQRTYTMNNQLSALHPNTIVEIHEIVNKP